MRQPYELNKSLLFVTLLDRGNVGSTREIPSSFLTKLFIRLFIRLVCFLARMLGGICLLLFISCDNGENMQVSVVDDSASYTVTTYAGNGENGDDPVSGGPALLWYPGNCVFDAGGNLFVADGYNDEIKKINPGGMMTSFAGSYIGYADGTGPEAQFDRPFAMTIDGQGNLFVAESGGLRVRKVTSIAVVTTIAGNGTPGIADGISVEAQIDLPGGIAVDPQGNIYFTQEGFHGIRQISPSGEVSTFVGSSTPGFADGEGSAARFNSPYGIVCDPTGQLYVSDHENARIRKVSPEGVVTTFLRRSKPEEMGHIALDAEGNFYIVQSDFYSTEIIRYDKQGHLTKVAGGEIGYQDGAGNVAQFTYCSGLTTDTDGAIYFSDLLSNRIRKIKRN